MQACFPESMTEVPFTVCSFDLDNFKPFNDFFGFIRGDRCIVSSRSF